MGGNEKPPELQYEALRHPEAVGLVTTTYYPGWYPGNPRTIEDITKVRGDLALHLAARARDMGYKLFVGDGGSPPAFLDALEATGAEVYRFTHEDGREVRRRKVYSAASEKRDVRVIVWTEPEKVTFLDPECLAAAAEPILRGEADIVLPTRTADSWKTYPPYQVASEKSANAKYNGLLRSEGLLGKDDPDLDHFYGPRLFANTPRATGIFREKFVFEPDATSKVQEQLSLDMYEPHMLPLPRALQEKLRVRGVEIPYHQPQELFVNEQGNPTIEEKRVRQRHDILIVLIHLLRLHRGDKKSRLRKLD